MAIEVNGVSLPDIPEDVLAQYPYVTIYRLWDSANDPEPTYDGFVLLAADSPILYDEETDYLFVYEEGGSVSVPYNLDSATWYEVIENEEGFGFEVGTAWDSIGGGLFSTELKWSNHDIYVIDQDAWEPSDTIYFARNDSTANYYAPKSWYDGMAAQVRRLTGTSDKLTTDEMLEDLKGVEVGSGGNTLVVTCTTGSTVVCSKDGETKTATEDNGTWTFTGLAAGVWTVTATLDGNTATSEVEIVDSALTLRYPEMVSWADGTDEQIAVMIDAAKAGRIDLQTDGGWAVGDKRTISIAAFTGGGDVAHEAQEIDIVISSFEDYNSCGCIMQFDFAEALASGGRMNSTEASTGGYGNSEMYLTTIPALVEALPSWLKERLVEFSVLAANNGGPSASIATVPGNKLALRSETEVTGKYYSMGGEGTQIPYYATTENRIKNLGHGGEAYKWWERSVSASADWCFLNVNATGGADYTQSHKTAGISPFGCI